MNYINNENLLAELKIYVETGIQTEELGRMLLLLAKRYSDRGSFSGYSYKDDMICEAILTCLRYMHNFDTEIEKPNPFAYFSRIIHNSFLNYISKQKKHSKIKDICYKNIDFIVPDSNSDDEYSFFGISGIDYQPIRGNKKKKKRKKKVVKS
jgi:DNA-directed RNA polymerase specialized sigma24 family protein